MKRSKLEDYSRFPMGPPLAGSIIDPHCLGYVYIIGFEEPGIVKIGSAKCPGIRLKELQCGNPFELHLRSAVGIYEGDAIAVEFASHRLAVDHKIRNEWFALDEHDALRIVLKAARNLKVKFGAHAVACEASMQEHESYVHNAEQERRSHMMRRLGIA